MSETRIKKQLSKGKNNPMYGKKHSEESKKKMSQNRSDNSGKNHHMYGKKHSKATKEKMSKAHKGHKGCVGCKRSNETKIKISKAHNTTGYYRVTKQYGKTYKQGFTWCYQYTDDDKKLKKILCTDIKRLEKKVKERKLPWYKFKGD